jgi:hypothetical protein
MQPEATPDSDVRSFTELAEAVERTPDGFRLHLSPMEYLHVIQQVQSVNVHGDVWSFDMRNALAGRFDEFSWHATKTPAVEVVVDFKPRAED